MRVFLIICILFASFGCADHPKSDSKLPSSSPQPEIQSGPSPGRLLTMQPVVTQPGIHYAAYFPKTYDENKKFPVMILFDPQGHPETPLEKYKALADEMGFILMGSHESKNGLGARETADIFLAMAAQAKALPKADTNLVYAGGFSGGGRVASMMGLAPLNIRGILTCGAGVPKGAWFGVPPYVIVSIAGDADMNLSEVKTIINSSKRTLWFKVSIAMITCLSFLILPSCEEDVLNQDPMLKMDNMSPSASSKKIKLTGKVKDVEGNWC